MSKVMICARRSYGDSGSRGEARAPEPPPNAAPQASLPMRSPTLPHVTIPWSTAVFLPIAAGLLAAQISLALEQSSCRRRLASRRRGVLSVVPALFAAPVCCGAAMLSFLGTGATLTLATITPWLLISTCLLLAGGLYRQRRATRCATP